MGVSAEGGLRMQRAASATRLVPSLPRLSLLLRSLSFQAHLVHMWRICMKHGRTIHPLCTPLGMLTSGEEHTKLLHPWATPPTQMRLPLPPWEEPCLAWVAELPVLRSLMHILRFRGPSGPIRCEATWPPRLIPLG